MNTQPDQCRTAESACGRQCLDLAGHDGDHTYERARTVPVLAASSLPAAEACTDPSHTGPIRTRLGCTGPDPDVTVPRAERSYWQDITDALNALNTAGGSIGIDLDGTLTDHRAWSVVWDRDDERWTLIGYDDEPEGTKEAPAAEPPLLDPFTEAAVRRGALLGGADAIEALPQDHECDPGRGDAVKLLRRLAGLTSTTEQPTGLTWQDRADHAVRLYATTAIELEDARRENGRLRERLAELEQQRDNAHAERDCLAMAAMFALQWKPSAPMSLRDGVEEILATMPSLAMPLTAAELEQGQADAEHLAAEHPDTIAALVDEIADDIPHRRAPQIAADYLARHARLLADEARKRLTERDAEMRADGYRGRVAWCSGIREVVKLLDSIAAERAPKAAEKPEQPLAFPQLAVPCPQCDAPARQLCTSHSGTRTRTNDTHQARTRAYRDQQAGR
ncbi:zinc finger domain-containing protein [Streptomyces californicus]